MFGTEVVIPVEIGEPFARTVLFEPSKNEDELRANLDMLQEVREATHIREYVVKARVARAYWLESLGGKKVPRTWNSASLATNTVDPGLASDLSPKWRPTRSTQGSPRVRNGQHGQPKV
ncbi:hypothetical protein CR513_40407, partial [Mucuna pruriens]